MPDIDQLSIYFLSNHYLVLNAVAAWTTSDATELNAFSASMIAASTGSSMCE